MPGLISKVSSNHMRQEWTLNHLLQPLRTKYHASYAFYLLTLLVLSLRPHRRGVVKYFGC